MKFDTLIETGNNLIKEYKDSLANITRAQVQTYRDELSALSVTMAIYMSDFYEDFIGYELKRKLHEARETERYIVEKFPANRSAIKARIDSEELYTKEVEAERKFKRASAMLTAWNQILNSMASRMNEHK